MTDIETIANELVELCRKGDFKIAHEKLYHPNAHSIESQGEPKRVDGLEAIKKKGEWWQQTFEVHDEKVSEPIIADTYFSVKFYMDVTHKESGNRNKSSEIAVFEVKEGKIVGEQFFY